MTMDASLLDSSVASSMTDELQAVGETGGTSTQLTTAVVATDQSLPLSKRQANRRPRTKGIVKRLQQQIEFYFGDSNLPKDKFLQQKIKEDENGFVPVEIIAGFRKMKSLSEDLSLVKRAIENSTIVELSEDKLGVRRSVPLPDTSQADIDARTVYIENLPPLVADHDAIRKVFKTFGNITFVSLPRHKVSGAIKGFAFVEFSTRDEALSAIEFFKNKDKIPPPTSPRSRKSSTVLSKEGEQVGVASGGGGVVVGVVSDSVKRRTKSEEGGGQKRKRDDETSTDPSAEHLPPASKRVKRTSSSSEHQSAPVLHATGVTQPDTHSQKDTTKGCGTDQSVSADSNQSEKTATGSSNGGQLLAGSRKRHLHEELSEQDGVQSSTDREGAPPIKSARLDSQSSEMDDLDDTIDGGVVKGGEKKKRKNRQHKKKQHLSTLRDLDIRVMAKSEWVELKKLYCNMQKEHMKELKKEMKSLKDGSEEVEGDGGGGVKGAGCRRDGRGFVGRCLVRVECGGEGGANVDEIREVCSRHGPVAYVDIREGDKEGHVRYAESGCVERLLEDSPPTGTTFLAVEEEDERAYFLKCQAHRKQQFKQKGQRKQRGQDKLISRVLKKIDTGGSSVHLSGQKSNSKKAATHIRFSDSDSEDGMS